MENFHLMKSLIAKTAEFQTIFSESDLTVAEKEWLANQYSVEVHNQARIGIYAAMCEIQKKFQVLKNAKSTTTTVNSISPTSPISSKSPFCSPFAIESLLKDDDTVSTPVSSPQHHVITNFGPIRNKKTRTRKVNGIPYPKPVTDFLNKWLSDNVAHPYPTEQEKDFFCRVTGLSMSQINNWFTNARRRSKIVLKFKQKVSIGDGNVDMKYQNMRF